MGILDYFSSPQAMALLGISSGLLEAGGPSRMPVSLGQGLSRGFMLGGQLGQSTANQQLRDAYLGKQTTYVDEQIQAMQAARAQQERMAPILQGFAQRLQGQPQGPTGNPMTPGHPGSSVMVGGPVGAPAQPQGNGGLPFSLEDVALLKLLGGPDLTSAYTAGQPNISVRDGYVVDQKKGITGTVPQTNAQGFSTQLVPDGQGGFRVAQVPGGADAFRTQQTIQQGAQAAFAPPVTIPSTGPNQPPTMQTPYNFAIGQGAPDVLGVRGSGPQSGIPAGLTPAQTTAVEASRTAATTAARGDAERVQELEKKIPNLLSVERRLTNMAALSKDDATFAAAGADIKKSLGSIVQAFGLKVNEAKTANTESYLAHVAELLKDRLASKDFGSGSGVSNLDIIAAQKPLPDLANTPQGRLQIIEALRADTASALKDAQAARDYFDANTSLRQFKFPSELRAEEQKKKDALPKEPGSAPSSLPAGITVKRVR